MHETSDSIPATSSRLDLRPFAEDDRITCQRIAARAAMSSYGQHMPEFRGRFDEAQPLEPADARIVAVCDGEIAGFIDLIGNHVSNLFIDPGFQCRGIGTALMAEAERRLTGDLTLLVFTRVAIVERSGPEMLKMLRRHMMGQNQVRFSSAIDEVTTHTCRSMASSQLQLI